MYDGLFIARVTEQHRELYKAVSRCGEIDASVSGKLVIMRTARPPFPPLGTG
jgi:ribosome biogenesis GTPase